MGPHLRALYMGTPSYDGPTIQGALLLAHLALRGSQMPRTRCGPNMLVESLFKSTMAKNALPYSKHTKLQQKNDTEASK